MENKKATNCETCTNYVYDEDYDCYVCMVNLDEDEMYRFLQGTSKVPIMPVPTTVSMTSTAW